MNAFDKGFGLADAAAFRDMGAKAIVYNVSSTAGVEIDAIEMPVDRSSFFAKGGEAVNVVTTFEVDLAALRDSQATQGWFIRRSDGRAFLISRIIEQGNTATIECIDTAGGSMEGDW
jgi:hypothetical protein